MHLGEPYTRQLDGNGVRITYWIAGGRRVVLLTVFRKTRMRESQEVARARALARCIDQLHTVDEHDGSDDDGRLAAAP